ncbi:putative small nucleolar ribonucleoprotein complex subunit [Phaeomoniella chlamydospora]|uniref:Putative small nucleolar ribonucleoprotein complex subunit n=1 Tax=Phaeomoniella chlamydospora TaxID=158046 RepID=A0A0G2DX01_PHACM|nr:putative small nucleolar ribonucleoprotein complex subunit [Phaeomoniella chlamydospora]
MLGAKVKAKTKQKSSKVSNQHIDRSSEDEGMTNAPTLGNEYHDDFADDRSDYSEEEKDETEKTLEKLVFGDDEGFLQSLKRKSSAKGKELVLAPGAAVEASDVDEEQDLENVDDADLFFLDSGPGTGPSGPNITSSAGQTKDSEKNDQKSSIWWDSDDDRIVVSLASNSRLRKLRDTEADDVVSGRDYIHRLRRQYERLHPRPSWASAEAIKSGHARKRRRRDSAGSDIVSASEPEDENDSEEMSSLQAKPLAELLRSADSLIDTSATSKSSRFKLRPEVVDIHRLKDITSSSPSAITALSFHEKYPILLATAGPASTVFLHHVSPQSLNPNPLLTSLLLKRTPLHTVEFRPSSTTSTSSDLTQIFLSSRRRYMHTWHLSTGLIAKHTRPIYGNKSARATQRTLESFRPSPCGRYIALIGSSRKGGGIINILDASTMQWQCACRADGRGGVADFAWWKDGEGLAVLSKSGEVSEFSINERRIIARWIDEGNVGPTTIVIGGRSGKKGGLLGPDRWVITGSTSGIVNIYDRTTWGHPPPPPSSSTTTPTPSPSCLLSNAFTPSSPTPIRTLENFTTPISTLTLTPDPDSTLLIISSRWKKDALRLIHLPSCTVYRNWPTASTPLGRISSVAVTTWGGSGSGGAVAKNESGKGFWLCVGNEKGRIGMWEIRV